MTLIYGPMLASYLLVPVAMANGFNNGEDYLFGLFLSWSYLFAPHMWACRSGGCPPAFWLEAGVLQWAAAGVVLGVATRSSSRGRLVWLTLLVAICTTLVAHFVLRALGYHVELDFP